LSEKETEHIKKELPGGGKYEKRPEATSNEGERGVSKPGGDDSKKAFFCT